MANELVAQQMMAVDPTYQGTLACNGWYQYAQYQYAQTFDRDEELLLNAARRSPRIKAEMLKVALGELLKEVAAAKVE